MGKKKQKETIGDHIFAIIVIGLMIAVILCTPFIIFYGILHLISLTPDVTINATGTWASLKIIFQFFLTTVVVTGIFDTILVKVLNLRKGIWGYISESLLMMAFFYLYVLVYSMLFGNLTLQNYGYLYTSIFLFIMYLLIHIFYWLSKFLYEKRVKKS